MNRLCVWCDCPEAASSRVGCCAPDGDGHLFPAVVLDLAQQKHKRLVLAAFDAMEHDDKRAAKEVRAEVERAARDKL